MKAPKWLQFVGWLLLIFFIYTIFVSPTEAAGIITAAILGLGAAVGAVFTFFNQLFANLGGAAAAASALAVAPVLGLPRGPRGS